MRSRAGCKQIVPAAWLVAAGAATSNLRGIGLALLRFAARRFSLSKRTNLMQPQRSFLCAFAP